MSETKQNEVSSSREFLKVQDISLLESVGGEDLRRLFNPFAWSLRDEVPSGPASEREPTIDITK